ncbi:hypothetical protein JTE90_017005 [Oedothorax gibbosus]|uniref:Basic proline-rich protein n=1 Tax=Oedothorax gibbosus TaxID=931172 RepID=A0AAV6UAQ6_9ARAC|nr:hypothetical protein JTE90_017005 [Oedothorax gibbosus]
MSACQPQNGRTAHANWASCRSLATTTGTRTAPNFPRAYGALAHEPSGVPPTPLPRAYGRSPPTTSNAYQPTADSRRMWLPCHEPSERYQPATSARVKGRSPRPRTIRNGVPAPATSRAHGRLPCTNHQEGYTTPTPRASWCSPAIEPQNGLQPPTSSAASVAPLAHRTSEAYRPPPTSRRVMVGSPRPDPGTVSHRRFPARHGRLPRPNHRTGSATRLPRAHVGSPRPRNDQERAYQPTADFPRVMVGSPRPRTTGTGVPAHRRLPRASWSAPLAHEPSGTGVRPPIPRASGRSPAPTQEGVPARDFPRAVLPRPEPSERRTSPRDSRARHGRSPRPRTSDGYHHADFPRASWSVPSPDHQNGVQPPPTSRARMVGSPAHDHQNGVPAPADFPRASCRSCPEPSERRTSPPPTSRARHVAPPPNHQERATSHRRLPARVMVAPLPEPSDGRTSHRRLPRASWSLPSPRTSGTGVQPPPTSAASCGSLADHQERAYRHRRLPARVMSAPLHDHQNGRTAHRRLPVGGSPTST